VPVMTLDYDAQTGRINSLTDATGESGVAFDYAVNLAPGLHRETLKDAFDVATEMIRDDRGNVVRQVQQAEITPAQNPEDRRYTVTVFTYDSHDNQTKQSEPFEVTGDDNKYTAQPSVWLATRTFDPAGNLLTETDALGATTRYTYDPFGQVQTISDPTGAALTQSFDSRGNLIAIGGFGLAGATQTLDPAGNVTAAHDAEGGLIGSYSYDAIGNLTRLTGPTGWTRSIEWDGNGNRLQTGYVWPDGQTEVTQSAEYDANGRPVRLTDEQGLTRELTYDAQGRVVSSQDAFGNTTTRLYDVRGDLIETRQPSKHTDGTPVDLVTRTLYDAAGRPVITAGPYLSDAPADDIYGERTVYDALGRQVRGEVLRGVVIGLSGEAPDLTATLIDAGTVLSATDTAYDAAGRVTATTDADGLVTTSEYDDAGRRTRTVTDPGGLNLVQQAMYDVAGRLVASVDALGHTTRYQSDEAQRTTTIVFPDGTQAQTANDALGRVAVETDPLGQARLFAYDDAGKLAAVTLPAALDADPGSPTFGDVVQPVYAYGYDAFGNRTTITDPKDRTTTTVYDAFNQPVSQSLPMTAEGEGVRRFYVASGPGAGQIDHAIDDEGRVIAFVYDNTAPGGGRLIETDYFAAENDYDDWLSDPQAHPPAGTAAYTYDAFGRIVQIDDIHGQATQYTFDARGRLTQVAAPEGTIHYDYDDDAAADRLTATWTGADPQAPHTRTAYGYDLLGRLETVTAQWRDGVDVSDEVTTYVYDDAGNLQQVTLPNGVESDYVYDNLNRLVALTHTDTNTSTVLMSLQYTLREDGRRSAVTEARWNGAGYDTTAVAWAYDALGRLTSENYDSFNDELDYSATYAYDLAGNRVRMATDTTPGNGDPTPDEIVTYTYDDNDRLLSQTKDAPGIEDDRFTAYAWGESELHGKTVYEGLDDTGDTLEAATYAYDLRGRLALAQIDDDGDGVTDTTIEYTYSDPAAGGVRTRTVQTPTGGAALTATYLIDAKNPTGYAQPLEESVTDAAQQVVKALTYTLGREVVAQAEAGAAGQPFFLLHDGHGSTRLVVDASAGPVTGGAFDFDAFGNAIGFDPAAAPTALGYNGEPFDPATGTQYLRARLYDPSVGRFNSKDPFNPDGRDPLGLHRYNYTQGDPVNAADPLGLFSIPEVLASVTVQSVLVEMVSAALGGVKDRLVSMLIPQFVNNTILSSLFPSGARLGARGTVNVPGAHFVGVTGGLELLSRWDARGAALFAFIGPTLSSKDTGFGALAPYAGALWNAHTSDDYEGHWRLNITLPFVRLPERVQRAVLESFELVKDAIVSLGLFCMRHEIDGRIPKGAIQYGLAFNAWLAESLLSVSAGISFGFGNNPIGVSLQYTLRTGIDNNPPITVSALRYFQLVALPHRPVPLG
jgi:RHS repeat-associated protein